MAKQHFCRKFDFSVLSICQINATKLYFCNIFVCHRFNVLISILASKMLSSKKLNYIAPFEVVVHNKPYDCWVSFIGKVFNVTPVIQQYENDVCIKPLLAHAGKDISNWFDERTGEIMHYVHPVTGVLVPYCPHGRIPDIKPQVPSASWRPIEDPPWWKNEKYLRIFLSKK